MKKTLTLVLALVLLTAGFAGCGQKAAEPQPAAPSEEPIAPAEDISDEAEDAPGEVTKLVIGLDDTFAPMGFRDEANNLIGFDIELAEALGEELGIEIVFQPISWDAKEMELETKNIDCVWNGMSRTKEREEMWTLSQNYLNNKLIIMTLPDVKVSTKEDLANYTIGTQEKSSALEVIMADDIFPSIEANLSQYVTYDDCIYDMQAGRIQVMIVDEVLGQYKNNNLDEKLLVAEVDFGDDYYCIGFRKDDTELCALVEKGLKALEENGKAAEISKKWFGQDLLLEIK